MTRSTLTISEATERLKGMGAGELIIHVHGDGIVTVTAIGPVNRSLSKRQDKAEFLLQKLLEQHDIVEHRPPGMGG
jgi:hypothetical protein